MKGSGKLAAQGPAGGVLFKEKFGASLDAIYFLAIFEEEQAKAVPASLRPSSVPSLISRHLSLQ